MGFLRSFLGLELIERPPELMLSTAAEDAIDKIIHAREHPRSGAYRLPSVNQALGVPSIQRAVSLISSTTGMLTMQGFRNGEVMDGRDGRPEPPRLITRPDPDEDPYTFYSMTAAQAAKYGEFVWWIASRDGDGLPSALVNVPLNELQVQNNPDSRRFPKYRWGKVESTRWTPANPTGAFVHRKYPLGEPYALRGEGPLQLGKIAVSISVEANVWAANFYGGGGHPSDIVKWADQLDPTLRDELDQPDQVNGLSEADRLKAQYIARDSNTPLVIDSRIESITAGKIDEAGAQMLEARLHQNGDAARLFGMSGHWVEYVQSGTSLTYQNLEMAFTELIRVCLQPLYLEPIEQAMSDLLPRTTSSRFNVKGFLRADIKTRFEVHGIAIDKGIYGPEYAQMEEGILPGDVEYAPIPFAPPQAVPVSVPRVASLSRDVRCPSCNKLVAKALGAGSEVECGRCKTLVRGPDDEVRELTAPVVNVAPPEITVHNHPPTIEIPPLTVTMNMPDTQTWIGQVEHGLGTLVAATGALAIRHDELTASIDERLADMAQAQRQAAANLAAELSRQSAEQLAESRKPREIKIRRDGDRIVGATSEAA